MTETLRGCEEARSLASRELDGELDAAGLARLDAHLASCAACTSERASLDRIDGLLQDAYVDHPFDERLARDIVRMAEARSVKPAATAEPRGVIIKFRSSLVMAAAAAAVLLIAVGAGIVGGPSDEGTPVAPTRAILAKAVGAGLRIGDTRGDVREPVSVREDELVINNGGDGSLFLDDGTRVDLRADTAVALHRERDGGITVQIGPKGVAARSGAVFCEVAKQKKHPFRVMTGSLSAEVLGTKFLVHASGDQTGVSVIEGRVLVRSVRKDVILTRDQEAVVEESQPNVLLPRPIADARQLLAWNRRVLEQLPSAVTTPVRPAAPIQPGRPTAGPVGPTAPPPPPGHAPVDGNLDNPIDKPDQKAPKKK
ncbi:MAG: FecR domain-containing protein [Planctomycetota bacterium]